MRSFSSLEYDDRPVKVRHCDSPGCVAAGDYRAPKNRELTDYYWFCLDHVRDYNRSWDFFAGMNPHDVENYNRAAGVWERPSWPMGEWRQREQALRDAMHREFFTAREGAEPPPASPPMSKVEKEALALLDLMPPVTFAAIKAQYRLLVKKHHPDANAGSRDAEEIFKGINQAFTVLRQIYESEEE